jgi:hypothetical protein
MRLELPIHTVSLLNQREHWRITARRKKLHRAIVTKHLEGLLPPPLPVRITLTRLSAGTLDAHDNLPSAFKHVVDALATWLEVDDADPRISWIYGQMKTRPGAHSILLEIN